MDSRYIKKQSDIASREEVTLRAFQKNIQKAICESEIEYGSVCTNSGSIKRLSVERIQKL